jgi:lipid-A-disaccharide synthase-like uncharacterized protein
MSPPTYEAVWLGVGFLGQGIFTARFLVQWAVSEKQRDSVVPVAFWWISLCGGLTLLAYTVHKRDPPLMVGQAMGLLVYVRNLMLVAKARRRAARRQRRVEAAAAAARSAQAPPSRPHRVDAPERGVPRG